MTLRTISRGEVVPEERAIFNKHVCPPTFNGGPIDPVPATVEITRELLVNFDLPLPDGSSVQMWMIADPEDPVGGKVFPSKTIRVTEGDIVHAKVSNKTNTHTIHWHGIEPTTMNDGVGKDSFEVSGTFIYQWLAGEAGTYFYHCHKNTTLHFEMGLYGLLIIDPPEPEGIEGQEPPYKNGGPGFVRRMDDIIPYDVEAFWVADEIDSGWHTLGHNAFMQKCDPDNPAAAENFIQDGILNNFNPDIFMITGVTRRLGDSTPITEKDKADNARLVAVNAGAGQTVLIRILNAGYTVQQYTIGLDAEVIAMDGRALGHSPFSQFSFPFIIPAGKPFRLTSARRWDLIIKPAQAGTFPAHVEFFDWVNGKKLGTVSTEIKVA